MMPPLVFSQAVVRVAVPRARVVRRTKRVFMSGSKRSVG